MPESPARRPRAVLLWTLAAVIIVADQLSKAWFVYKLGTRHHFHSFTQFLPHYWSEFQRNPHGSIILDKYHNVLTYQDIYVWDPWIRFHLTQNTGAAWSIFQGNSFALSFVSILIAGLLWVIWRRNFVFNPGMTIAIGAIIGGALGNSIDRFRMQEVVDFIAVRIPYIGVLIPPEHTNPYDFPIFNVADASAVCGTLALAGYLLYLDLTAGKRKREKEHAEKLKQANRGGGFPEGPQLDDEALENLKHVDTSSIKPWEPGQLDDEAIDALHHVDTHSVKPFEQSEADLVKEQEEVSTQFAEQETRARIEAEVPGLTTGYGGASLHTRRPVTEEDVRDTLESDAPE